MSDINNPLGKVKTSYLAHDEVRPGQQEMIEDCLEALGNIGGIHFAAAPTGIGKTAAALSASLKIAKQNHNSPTVCFLTPRQGQHKIVIDTIQKINQRLENDETITVVDIIGREGMCEVIDRSTGKCECEKGRNNEETQKNLRMSILEAPRHVNWTIEQAKKRGVCAWATARSAAKYADVLVCDYNHFFIEAISELSLPSMGLTVGNSILIVDEAHNLPDRIRMGMERVLTPAIVKNAKGNLEEHIEGMRENNDASEQVERYDWAFEVMDTLHSIIKKYFHTIRNQTFDNGERKVESSELNNLFQRACDKTNRSIGQKQITDNFDPVRQPREHMERGLKELMTILFNVKIDLTDEDDGMESDAHKVASLIETLLRFEHSKALVYVYSNPKGSKEGRIISHLLDPGLVSGPIFAKCLGSILMSGTLYPPSMYSNLLNTNKEKTTMRTYQSPFLHTRRPIMVANDVTTRYKDRSYENTNRIQSHLQALCDATPGHLAVFLPSYSMLEEYIENHSFANVRIVSEQRDWSKQDLDSELKALENSKNPNKRIMLAGVFGGRLAEGIDYKNGVLDAVACIGIPNPPPSVYQKAYREYIEGRFGKKNAWRYTSSQPAINSILQAMGRPIRGIADRALILLLDKRNTDRTYIECYPSDIRMNATNEPETTKSFARRFFSRVKRLHEGSS
tara:strand:- start:6477 stop:8519 length:2043 start_codon:yes stop_codon:yes gene_type:complete